MSQIELDPGEEVEVLGTNLILPEIGRNRVVVRSKGVPGSPPPVDPPPKPGILAYFTFEVGDYELWERHPAFEQGRSKTHQIPPPAIVGSFDLRMKYNNSRLDGGLFEPGENGVARRTFKVEPGERTLLLYGVSHDDGVFTVRAIDEDVTDRPVVLSATGSEFWNENEYLPKEFTFTLQGENVTIEFDYTAPALNMQSGIKVGYGQIT